MALPQLVNNSNAAALVTASGNGEYLLSLVNKATRGLLAVLGPCAGLDLPQRSSRQPVTISAEIRTTRSMSMPIQGMRRFR
ncbi:hypothetical protein [Streptomyces spinosirectus]